MRPFVFVSGENGFLNDEADFSQQSIDSHVLSQSNEVLVSNVSDGANKQSLILDINNDGTNDVMGVDLLTQRLSILVSSTDTQDAISKVVEGISGINQVDSVSVSLDGDIVVTTTVQQ